MYREGPNKLIIYPDDVVFMKANRAVKHATPVSCLTRNVRVSFYVC
ncbi:unnamed protein product [Trichobilharzia regenti]|nr:unnamed protein product [Trichobilharzia regenti]